MRQLLRMLCAISAILAVGGEATARADQLAFTDWQATTPFDGPRTSHAAVLANNRIYILGGLYASGNHFRSVNNVERRFSGTTVRSQKGRGRRQLPLPSRAPEWALPYTRGSSMWSEDLPTRERLPTFSTPASCRTACLVDGQRAPIDW